MKKRTHTYKFTIYFDRNANCECETEEISYEELTKMLNMPVKQALNKSGYINLRIEVLDHEEMKLCHIQNNMS